MDLLHPNNGLTTCEFFLLFLNVDLFIKQDELSLTYVSTLSEAPSNQVPRDPLSATFEKGFIAQINM